MALITLPLRRNDRVCLLTAFAAGFAAIAELSLPRMKALCTAQGYELRALRIDACERPGAWIKIAPIRAALQDSFDWLVWFDIDVLVVRTGEDIRADLGKRADLYMA